MAEERQERHGAAWFRSEWNDRGATAVDSERKCEEQRASRAKGLIYNRIR